jgi:hypothetical protein
MRLPGISPRQAKWSPVPHGLVRIRRMARGLVMHSHEEHMTVLVKLFMG